MAQVRKVVRTELDEIVERMVDIDTQAGALAEEKKTLRERFLTLAERHVPEEGKSRIWPVPATGKRVRVTVGDPTIPVDYDRFMRAIGPDLFSEVCTVKSADLDVVKWNEVVEAERATDTQLQDCVGEPKPRSPSLYVEKIPKEKKE